MNGHILTGICQGYFGRPEIKPTIEMQEKLFPLLDPGRYDYHMIADITRITGTSYHARLLYTRAQSDFYDRHRFESLIFCGGSKALKAAAYFGRSFVSFKTVLTNSLSESLDYIYKDRALPEKQQSQEQGRVSGLQKTIEHYMSDVLTYHGTLNPDVDLKAREIPVFETDHPFQSVFDTIDLINNDLNELAQHQNLL